MNRPDASACRPTPTIVRSSRRLTELLLASAWMAGGPMRSNVSGSAMSGLAAHQNWPYSRRNRCAEYVQGLGCCSPTQRAADKPTSGDIRIDVGVRISGPALAVAVVVEIGHRKRS